MAADGGPEELHAFAERLGLRRPWFQNHRLVDHYDLRPSKRVLALKLGAEPVASTELLRRCLQTTTAGEERAMIGFRAAPTSPRRDGPPPGRGRRATVRGLPGLAALALLFIALCGCDLLSGAATVLSDNPRTTATVTRVTDGDTLKIDPAIRGIHDVRLIGVDTPETRDPEEGVEPLGPEASEYAASVLEGEKVDLEFDEELTDRYGRLLAYLRPEDEAESFNAGLLRRGLAQAYAVEPNTRHERRFVALQRRARQEGLGIWGLPKAEQCELADRGNGIGDGTRGCAVP